MPTIALNKQALHDYEILERIEAGLVLLGHEVKSVRSGHISLKGSYATLHNTTLQLINAHIAPYSHAATKETYSPTRSRALLVHAKQIAHLTGILKQKGLTLVPLAVYTKNNRIKVELGVGRGKKEFEKRQIIKKKDVQREIRTALKRPR